MNLSLMPSEPSGFFFAVGLSPFSRATSGLFSHACMVRVLPLSRSRGAFCPVAYSVITTTSELVWPTHGRIFSKEFPYYAKAKGDGKKERNLCFQPEMAENIGCKNS